MHTGSCLNFWSVTMWFLFCVYRASWSRNGCLAPLRPCHGFTLRVFTYNLYTPFRQDEHSLFLWIVYSSSHVWALTPAGLFPQQTPVKRRRINWDSSERRTCPAWNVAMINTPVCFSLFTTQSVSENTHYSVCTGFYDRFSIYLHVKSISARYTMHLKYSSFVFSNLFLF